MANCCVRLASSQEPSTCDDCLLSVPNLDYEKPGVVISEALGCGKGLDCCISLADS